MFRKIKERNPFEVRDQIFKELPTEKLKIRLNRFIDPFKAPELYWELLSIFVNDVISHPPEEDWEWKIVSILTMKSIEELKNEIKK